MGIGRRKFLKLTSLALAGASVSPVSAVATNDNYYINKRLGVLFQKPKNWGYVALADFGELKDKQIISNVSEEDQDELYELMGGPACIITKYYQDKPE
ncbi:MAG: hypothetical protein P8P74_16590 [Crocinitomicaceae bacterium]|nr:hypothetical protein [Crocinitomicaceae bacterium]